MSSSTSHPGPGPGDAADRTAASTPGTARYVGELLDVLALRRAVLLGTFAVVSVAGIIVAYLAPGLLPPRPLIGAMVGVVAVLLAVAAAIAVDAADLTVRGVRHVRAGGGRVAAQLPVRPDPMASATLAQLIEGGARDGERLLALTPATPRIGGVAGWADAIGYELARRGRRVLIADLVSPGVPERPGIAEVARGRRKLSEAVTFDDEVPLARVGVGLEPQRALLALPELVQRLPVDIETMLVALPPVTRTGALDVVRAVDRALLFVAAHRTARVDLIAGLDALDSTGTPSEVVLLRSDLGAGRPVPAAAGVADPTAAEDQPADLGADAPPGAAWTAAPDPEPLMDEPAASRDGHDGGPAVSAAPAEDAGAPSARRPPPVTVAADDLDEYLRGSSAPGRSRRRAPAAVSDAAADEPSGPSAPADETATAEIPVATAPSEPEPAGDTPPSSDAASEADTAASPESEPAADPPPPADAASETRAGADDADLWEVDPDGGAAAGDGPPDRAAPAVPRDADPRGDGHLPADADDDLGDPDESEDPVRAAAAMQTLAQMVWSREDDPD